MKMTLTDFAIRTNAPPLQGRGRGWGLSAATLSELHDRAAQRRRNPNEVETHRDVIRLLRSIDGQEPLSLDEWFIDDFCSCSHPDPIIDRCRRRVPDELLDLLAAKVSTKRERISSLVSALIAELEDNAAKP